MQSISKPLNKSAIGMSILCAAHCVGMPFVLVMLPALASTPLADEAFHKMVLLLVLPMSCYAFWQSFQTFQKKSLLSYGMLGLTMMICAAFFGHDVLGENGEKIATLAGATMVAFSHLKNLTLCQKHQREGV